ncbi:hypothetical protein J1605_009075 [Eschrichtius robustus]|uniref:RRM domain-containing protein n=1 Tax=Eschrichtius robustus TaxID=9764 RepID=A0AB34GXZ2_ESCRO|nr:hypothetical protein J1605_009075 [Eschrichtius robustus]
MFIGGLSWQTSPDSLRDYFSKFGEIRECMVMRDPTTKRSRGFGFVTFADPASVDKVLGQPHHELDSKTIDPKVAFPRRAQPKMVTRTKKIFVGGLSANTVVEDVKQYFEQFGKDLGDQKEAFKLNEFSASSRMEQFCTFQPFTSMRGLLGAELAR